MSDPPQDELDGMSLEASPDHSATDTVTRPGFEPSSSATPAPGSKLLRYIILELVGQGGMGRVYRAYDPRLGREVALKLLHAESVDTGMSARLEREAKMLAKLSHPNVVTVFDVEHCDGALVVVMEFVPGQTLRRWLEVARPWPRVLEMFIAAGRGLAAAHRLGIVHRDFKPGNVLVGDDGRVRVLDFGLAQPALDLLSDPPASSMSDPSGSSLHPDSPTVDADDRLTESGVVLGTPRYMAPEQHYGFEIDVRADVYAFCVALWEGLTGGPPFAGDARSLNDLFLRKREGPGPWPARVRVPARIVAALRRGLAFDRASRWPTMDPLLRALQYDPKRRQAKWLVGGSLAISAALASVGGYGWLEQRARRCEGAAGELEPSWNEDRKAAVQQAFGSSDLVYAKDTLARVESSLDGYAEAWIAMHGEACEAATIRGEESANVLDLRMTCLQRARMRLDAVVGLLEKGEPDIVENAVKLVSALPRLEPCSDLEALRAEAPPPDDPSLAEAESSVRRTLAAGESLLDAGRYSEGLDLVRDAAMRARQLQHPATEAEAELLLADALEENGDFVGAEQSARRALELGLQHGPLRVAATASSSLTHIVGDRGARIDEALWFGALAESLAARSDADPLAPVFAGQTLGNALHRAGRFDEAEAAYRNALAQLPASEDSLLRSTLLSHLGGNLESQGRYREAIEVGTESFEIVTRVVGEEHPVAAASQVNLANALAQSGDLDAARGHYEHAALVFERVGGPEHPNVAAILDNIGLVDRMQGHYARAIEHQRRALALREAALGPDHVMVATTAFNLGTTLGQQGQHEEAMALLERALRIQETKLGEIHPHVASTLGEIGRLSNDRGEYEKALQFHRRAIDVGTAALGKDHVELAAYRLNYGVALDHLGQTREAIEHYQRALELIEGAVGTDHPNYATILHNLGGLLAQQRRYEQARTNLERALEIRRRHQVPPEELADTSLGVAKLWWDDPAKRSQAAALVRSALAGLDATASEHAAKTRRQLERWLAEPSGARAEVEASRSGSG